MDASWQRCLDAFLDSIEDISGSQRSRARYAYILASFFTDPERNPDTYTHTEVQSFLNAKSTSPRNRGRDISPNTKNNRLMVLNSFYKFAATYQINGDALLQTKPPTYGLKYLKIRSNPHALSAQEIERFFAAIPHDTIKGVRDHALFLTYFLTAKRRAEIISLTVSDIQEATLIDRAGERYQGHLFQYHAKGRSRILETHELPPLAYDAILRYWRASGRFDTLQPTDPVFTSTRPDQLNQMLTGDYANALYKDYNTKAGLDSRYSLHSLRHASARQRYELGSDIRAIQETLDHTSLTTTSLYLKSLTVNHDSGADLLTKRFGHLGHF